MEAGLCELNVNIQFGPRADPPSTCLAATPHVHSLHARDRFFGHASQA
jgi:hypothetical protein